MAKGKNGFEDARKSALMNQAEMAEKMGCSVPLIVGFEKDPLTMTGHQMLAWINAVNPDGQKMIKDELAYFFSMA